MMQVVALIDEDDGAYGVSFPDFPGCTKNAFAVLIFYHPPTRAVRVNITLEESLMERQCSKLSKRIK